MSRVFLALCGALIGIAPWVMAFEGMRIVNVPFGLLCMAVWTVSTAYLFVQAVVAEASQ